MATFVLLFLTFLCLGDCYEILTKNDSDETLEILQMFEAVDFLTREFLNITSEKMYEQVLAEFTKLDDSKKLLAVYMKQDLYLRVLLYAKKCNTNNPTYEITKKSYDSSKDNSILACNIISAIGGFLYDVWLFYFAHAIYSIIKRMSDRVPNPTF